MNTLNEHHPSGENSPEKTGEGLKRAWNILKNPSYHRYQIPQFIKTVWHPKIDYSIDSNKRTICLIPGLSCSVPTYSRLLKEITKDGKFNVLKLEDFPENFRAIFSKLSLDERARLLLQTLENAEINGSVDLIGHSIGGPVAAYAKILEQEKKEGEENLIGKIITLSAPMSGSVGLSELPILPAVFRSLGELHPDSNVMKRLQQKGSVDHRFITLRDELIRREEMDFSNGEEHLLTHGHFDYMLGPQEVIAGTASQIVEVLDT